MPYSCLCPLHHARLSAAALVFGAFAGTAFPATVQYDLDVAGVATDDTLQDLFPEINHPAAAQDGLVTGLVDGGSRNTVPLLGQAMPGNGCRLSHSEGPVFITWDLGAVRKNEKAELKRLWIWL